MTAPGPLGIIAGAGVLPVEAARAGLASGRQVFAVSLIPRERLQPELAALHGACLSLSVGAVGKAMAFFRRHDVQDLVFAGGVRKPGFMSLIPDAGGLRLLASLRSLQKKGDDSVLSAVIRFFEEEGFRVLRADEIAGSLLLPVGTLTARVPSEGVLHSVWLAASALRALGPYDMGQAAVVEHGVILGVEGPEGTDALLARCAPLRRERDGMVLIKMTKPGQDRRADLPAFGPETVLTLARLGYEGAALEAGGTLMLERDRSVRLAEEAGLFVAGLDFADVRMPEPRSS